MILPKKGREGEGSEGLPKKKKEKEGKGGKGRGWTARMKGNMVGSEDNESGVHKDGT